MIDFLASRCFSVILFSMPAPLLIYATAASARDDAASAITTNNSCRHPFIYASSLISHCCGSESNGATPCHIALMIFCRYRQLFTLTHAMALRAIWRYAPREKNGHHTLRFVDKMPADIFCHTPAIPLLTTRRRLQAPNYAHSMRRYVMHPPETSSAMLMPRC